MKRQEFSEEELRNSKRIYYEGMKVELGYIYWQVQNLHVYERHFDLVK